MSNSPTYTVSRADTKKRTLSNARQQLLTILQTLNYGRIEKLEIRGGEPILDPMPLLVREHKFASEKGPRAEVRLADFTLRDQQLDLLRLLDDVNDGTILVLTCKGGLPFSAELLG
jgi:hypothetical protein